MVWNPVPGPLKGVWNPDPGSENVEGPEEGSEDSVLTMVCLCGPPLKQEEERGQRDSIYWVRRGQD